MTSLDLDYQEVAKGFRRAHQAALFAHLRTVIAQALSKDNPIVGLHGIILFESSNFSHVNAGATPDLSSLLSMLSFVQGKVITQAVARQTGDLKTAQAGDRFDPELGKARCENCDDGDPTGDHAKNELEENGKAWLGLVYLVATEFYGEYLSDKARALLSELNTEALSANAHVS